VPEVAREDIDHKPVVFDKPGPYELLANAACQEGEEFLVRDCVRYTSAIDLNARTFAVRSFKEFDRKYGFRLPPPAGPVSP
jgi:hypothetical protein